ncbi:MAG: GHMP kinase [Chloroflexia bacterium]
MIITQTPLRISLFGGGTDFPEFYRREGGCVLSTAIDKYVFAIIKERFDALIRVGYTRTEIVETVDQVQHDLVREALRLTGISRAVEIATMADVPAQGTGLGSSGAVTVGLLNAMHVYRNDARPAAELAAQACTIELERLGRPIGRQDQYIAAFGGLRFLRFQPDDRVEVEPVEIPGDARRILEESLLLFYTGKTRDASAILAEQRENIPRRLSELREVKALAEEARQLLQAGDVDTVGQLLDEGWQIKKRLASGISNGDIEEMYQAALRAGALGGKLCGAGGGGFLLLYCPRERQEALRRALSGYRELPFRLEKDGSKVVLNIRR